jgi:hypothetical protein
MLDGVKALETLRQMVDKPQQNYWSKLKDSTGSMDVSQITYVMSQDSVKEKYREMLEAFNSFLFEKFKEDFSAVPTFQPVVEDYVNAVLKSAENYGNHVKDLEEENKRLREALDANRCQAE